MTAIDRPALEAALSALIAGSDGPGGVAGVVHEGRVIHRHAWGHADPATRLPMTAGTLFPICSITKQFTCALLADLAAEPARLDACVAAHLPNLKGAMPTAAHLANNQSGLRDSWALTVLHGAHPEGRFTEADASRLLARLRQLQFAPGSQYSYCNGNFHILGRIAETVADRPLADLLSERLFAPAGMATARLAPDTGAALNGITGHEGASETGLFAAVNRIHWWGDAGIAASLDDMLAWEAFIDRTRSDARGLYNRLARPQHFADGRVAPYGNGLRHERLGDMALTGHGGALRGFRTCRLHAAAARLSVVVMLNHEGDARAASLSLLRAALGQPDPMPASSTPPDWAGNWLDPASGLVLALRAAPGGFSADFGGQPELLVAAADGGLCGPTTRLRAEGSGLHLSRARDNLFATLQRLPVGTRPDIAGGYVAPELDARLLIAEAGGRWFAGFTGFLGPGPMHEMRPLGADVWRILCPRSMDAPAPQSWTLRIRRNSGGHITGLGLGCWLARGIDYLPRGGAGA